MKILNYFISFIHKAKTFPRLLFLSSIVMCWFGNALSAYANDGNCHAIYSVSPNGSSIYVPCVVLDSASDGTVYEFALNQVSKDEALSFTVENIKPTTSTVSGEKATFNEATGVLILPLVEARDTADQTTHYAAQMLVSPTSDNQSRLVVSSLTPLNAPNIAVCHIPSGNPEGAHTIYISMNVYENVHKKHGDTLGECGSSSPDDQGNTGNGDSPASESPKMVRLVSVSSADTDKITVDWFPAQDNQTLHQDMIYQVHVSPDNKFIPEPSTLRYQDKGIVTAIITDLSANSDYTVMVTAIDEDGNESWSNRLDTKTVAESAKRTSKKVWTPKSLIAGENENEIILPASEPVPELGDYLVSEQGNGYLKKVIAVTKQKGQTHVQMEQAVLTDIFESVEFSTTVKIEDIPPDANQATSLRRRNIGNKHQVTWLESGLTLSETETPQLRKVPAMISMATLNNTSGTRRLDVNGKTQTKTDDYTSFSGPTYISAKPGKLLSFDLNTKNLGVRTDIVICKIEMTEFDHKDNTLEKLSKPTYSLAITDSGQQGKLTVNWNVTKQHVHTGGLPYNVTFMAFTDGAKDGCDGDEWNGWWAEKLELKIPIYVTMGALPEKEQKSLSFSGGFDVKNTMTIDFKPAIKVSAKTKGTSLQEAEMIVNANIGFRNKLQITATGTATLDKTKPLLNPRKFIKVFVVYGVPIVIAGEFKINLRVEGNAKGKIDIGLEKYFGFPEARVGLRYVKGIGWKPVKKIEPKYEFKISGNGDAGVDLKLTLVPDLTISFYGSASGRMLVEPYLYGEAGIHGHFLYQNDNSGALTDSDYWFTNLETGGGLDMRLYAGLHILSYNIVSYPENVKLSQTDKFALFHLIGKKPFAKLPTLSAAHNNTLPTTGDSRAILVKGSYKNTPNPFYKLFGGPTSFFPFERWTEPKIISINKSSAKITSYNGNKTDGRYWFQYTKQGNYKIRLAGQSNLHLRQVANEISLSLPDNDGDGMVDHWEQRYGVSDPQADPDQDGISNLQEFQQGKFPKKSDAPIEEPPTDEPPTDKPPTDEPPTDEPPTDEPPTDEPPTDEPPTDEPPTDEPPTDEPPTDEPPTDEPPTVGASCGIDLVYDCALKCVSEKDAKEWQGDGGCDNGEYGIVLTCPAFNNDDGDCDIPSTPPPPPPGPMPKAGASCGSGYIYDCILHCVNASYVDDWKGDGNCDDGEYGIVLTCSAFNNDGGDCSSSTTPTPEPEPEPVEPPYPPTKITSKDSTSPYATTENRFSAGQGTWYAYGRVLELVAWEYLPIEVGDRMRNAFAGKYGAHSKNWPTSQFLGGNWVVTSSTTFLPTEKRQRGLLAVWSDGTYGHVGFVEEVNTDKTQYRLSSFNRFGGESYQNDWYDFEGTNGALSGYYPQFYNLTKPNW